MVTSTHISFRGAGVRSKNQPNTQKQLWMEEDRRVQCTTLEPIYVQQ